MQFLNSSTAPATVKHNRWFSCLTQVQQAKLFESCRRRVLKPSDTVIEQDTVVRKRLDGLYVLVQGELNVCLTSPAGNEAVLSVIKPGQWFGEVALLDRQRRECEVRAVTPCVVGVIEHDVFQSLMADVGFAAKAAELVSAHARLLTSLLEDFLLRSARARTARRLLLLSRHDDIRANQSYKEVSVSQDTLASMLGMTRQTLGQQLRALVSLGAITQGYGRIEIASPVVLMAEASAG